MRAQRFFDGAAHHGADVGFQVVGDARQRLIQRRTDFRQHLFLHHAGDALIDLRHHAQIRGMFEILVLHARNHFGAVGRGRLGRFRKCFYRRRIRFNHRVHGHGLHGLEQHHIGEFGHVVVFHVRVARRWRNGDIGHVGNGGNVGNNRDGIGGRRSGSAMPRQQRVGACEDFAAMVVVVLRRLLRH